MELRHFFHKHPLSLKYYEDSRQRTVDTVFFYLRRNQIRDVRCEGCHEGTFGFSYSCEECQFFLHKSCGEQPRELQHPLHPQHPLILLRNGPNHELCCFCNKDILTGFAYHCSHCNFNLHLKCASIRFTIKAEFHHHLLNLFRKSLSFTCDVCGKEDKDMSYLCITCPLMVHLKCASLPLTVKHTAHHHALNLTDSSDHHLVNQYSNHRIICLLCVKKVDTDKVYYCSKCNFFAHLDCAAREGDREETFMLEFQDKQPLELTSVLKSENSKLDESIDSLSDVVKKIKMGDDKIEIAKKIIDFTHRHDLKLTDKLMKDKRCYACMRPISPPFYKCVQCKFVLHESCVQLPRKKRHPLHPHNLTLHLKPYDPAVSIFYEQPVCNVCDRSIYGRFHYNCENCRFNVDVQCSFFSDIFIHEGHEHQLILSRAPYSEKCSCCNYKGKVFKCADCEFALDMRCATLPLTMWYQSFKQPFKLCYKDNDSANEFYCDVCEKKRDPKHWFYYCEDLDFPAHIYCIFQERLLSL